MQEGTVDLTGRAYVVTGGTSGIGRSTAEVLTARGARVAVIGRKPERAAEVERACGAIPFVADVGDEEQMLATWAKIDERLGPIDGLLSNAGIAVPEGLVHTESAEVWDLIIRTNLRGTFLAVREGAKRLMARGKGGSIVCTSSIVATNAIIGGTNAYTATKGAILSLVRQLAVDYGPYGIRVNSLSPGATETPLMWDTTPPDQVEPIRKIINGVVPLGRIGDAIDCGYAVAWLLSDEASYVTGAELIVDGGANAKSVVPV
jgi:NAD(P)-dependent dehydrogenase (short-subunit alcohol dehydrogenase family)